MIEDDMMDYTDDDVPESVFAAFNWANPKVAPISAGHINQTFRVVVGQGSSEGRYALQRVNPVFGPAVHYDIEAITAHLEGAGLITPKLVRTRSGELWFIDEFGALWRAMTWIEGRNYTSAESPQLCYEAGRLVAGFHGVMRDFKYHFRNERLGVHDTAAHLKRLREALEAFDYHRLHPEVLPLAEEVLGHLKELPSLDGLPSRIVHGDLKISNLLFNEEGAGLCLIDLDTLAYMSVPVELGDAFRSWCNPTGEDSTESEFSMEHYGEALRGYVDGGGGWLSGPEREAIPVGVEIISLELTARFLTDALLESYFSWDRTQFSSAGEHNLHRALSQLSLARSIRQKRGKMSRLTREIFVGGAAG